MKTPQEIFEQLRKWRNDIAYSQGKQPFMILPNASLKAISENPPTSLADFKEIKGWGPVKIKLYGHLILDLLESLDDTNEQNAENSSKQIDYISVSQCIGLINKTFSDMEPLKIKGEISDISTRDNYAFFVLKDADGNDASLPCFVGWQQYEWVAHLLQEGLEVIVYGKPGVYKNGRLSFQVQNMEAIGAGALQKALEQLKKDLEKKGYFDESRKQQLPYHIKKIGLITSTKSAAINDFRENLHDLNFDVSVYDVYVEGEYAVNSITRAIHWFNKNKHDIDVLVVIRGGGGLENLKAYNSPQIAEQILLSKIPVITGIGHEHDESIADLVADYKCSTPTGVATFLSNHQEKIYIKLESLTQFLLSATKQHLYSLSYSLNSYSDRLKQTLSQKIMLNKKTLNTFTKQFTYLLQSILQKIKNLSQQFIFESQNIVYAIQEKQKKLREHTQQILFSFDNRFSKMKLHLNNYEKNLSLLNPENILKRGYSISYDKNGHVISSIAKLKEKDDITTHYFDGKIISTIKKIQKNS